MFRKSSPNDPRKPARERRLRLQRKILSERRASQSTCWNCGSASRALVLKSCDFPAGAAEAHVMHYPCDEKLRFHFAY